MGMDTTAGEVSAGQVRVFRRDADVAPRSRIVLCRHRGRLANRDSTATDAEIQRGVNLRIVELHQHVATRDFELSSAERHERRHVERADADDPKLRLVGRKAELARILVGERRFRFDADRAEKRCRLLEDATLRQGEDQRFGRQRCELRIFASEGFA